MEKAVIVAIGRSAVARGLKGAYIYTRIDDIATQVIKGVLGRIQNLPIKQLEDVLVGCAMPEGEQGLNVARNISFLAGLPLSGAAATINRFCASSLETINMAAQSIMTGNGDLFIAGGIESMTHVSMGGFNPSLNEKLLRDGAPAAYIGMGQTAENLARKYNISRDEQDKFAFESHMKAAAAGERGDFSDEIISVSALKKDGSPFEVKIDECVRRETSLEALAKLSPAFVKNGTVTAGNSSPISDGAAFAVIMSKKLAKKHGIKPIAEIKAFAVAGVDPAYMGLGPVLAVPKAMGRAGMKLKNIDLIELNEAFAAQSIAVVKELEINHEKLNVNGGAIAIGHPLGASGTRLMATLINVMRKRNKVTGLVTMCVGGGQGVATIVERV